MVRIFTDSEKIAIIEDYLSGNKTKKEVWQKYTGFDMEHGHLLRWMRQFGYSERNSNGQIMKTKQGPVQKDNPEDSFELQQMKNRVAELEKQLKDAEMKAIAYRTMVEIAEKEFNIPIRKKYSTKPSKK